MPIKTKSAAAPLLLVVWRFNGLPVEMVIMDSVLFAESAQQLMQANGAKSADAQSSKQRYQVR